MKIVFTVPRVGYVNLGSPIFNQTRIEKQGGIEEPIGVVTKILEYTREHVLIEAEIWDRFINIGYELNIINDEKEFNSISFDIK